MLFLSKEIFWNVDDNDGQSQEEEKVVVEVKVWKQLW